MRHATIQSCCALALAVMSGAVVAHWMAVRQTVAFAKLMQSGPAVAAAAPAVAVSTVPAQEDPVVKEARQILAEAKQAGKHEKEPAGAVASASNPELDSRFERAVATFEKLVEQNAELRNQVAETNRDLMALQFQVDSHSESFRPLKVSEDATPIPSSGVLPPKEAP